MTSPPQPGTEASATASRLKAAAPTSPPRSCTEPAPKAPHTEADTMGSCGRTSHLAPAPAWEFRRQNLHLTVSGRPFCLEVFSGSGRLTAALRAAGLDAWGVDYRGARLQSETPALFELNLDDAADARAFQRLLQHPHLACVFFTPPTSTCARCRERRVSGGGPPQLRSTAFPAGLPGIAQDHPRDFAKVQRENRLFELTARTCKDLSVRGIAWALEAPSNSLCWDVDALSSLFVGCGASYVDLQVCMWGGTRDKWSRLLYYPAGMFQPMRRTCPGTGPGHAHEPFSGAQGIVEAVFPTAFCQGVLACISAHLAFEPALPLEVSIGKGMVPSGRVRDDRAAAGQQPRGGKCRRLLPDFRAVTGTPC